MEMALTFLNSFNSNEKKLLCRGSKHVGSISVNMNRRFIKRIFQQNQQQIQEIFYIIIRKFYGK